MEEIDRDELMFIVKHYQTDKYNPQKAFRKFRMELGYDKYEKRHLFI